MTIERIEKLAGRRLRDRLAPTADETCPACGAPTETRYSDTYGVVPVVESEACTSCGWFAEFVDDGGVAA